MQNQNKHKNKRKKWLTLYENEFGILNKQKPNPKQNERLVHYVFYCKVFFMHVVCVCDVETEPV